MGDDGKFHRESDSSKPPATPTLDSRGSIFSKLRIKSWSFSRLCMAGDWRNMENCQQKNRFKKGGPWRTHHKKKVWKIWILPFQGRYQSFFFKLWPAKSLANHALSSSICWRISGFCKTCLLSELISPVEGWKHPMVDASPTIGVSYQKLLSRFRDSKNCSTTLDLISSDIPSQKKICDSSRPPQLKCCQLRWHLADVDTARTLGGQWSLGAPQIVVESTTTTTRSHVFFGRLEEDCQIFPPNNFWQWWCSPQLSYCLQFHVFLVRDTTHQQRCSHVLRCRTSAPPCCPCNLSFKSVGHSFQSTQNQFVYQVVPSDDYHLTEKGKTANNQQPTNNHQQPTP